MPLETIGTMAYRRASSEIRSDLKDFFDRQGACPTRLSLHLHSIYVQIPGGSWRLAPNALSDQDLMRLHAISGALLESRYIYG